MGFLLASGSSEKREKVVIVVCSLCTLCTSASRRVHSVCEPGETTAVMSAPPPLNAIASSTLRQSSYEWPAAHHPPGFIHKSHRQLPVVSARIVQHVDSLHIREKEVILVLIHPHGFCRN